LGGSCISKMRKLNNKEIRKEKRGEKDGRTCWLCSLGEKKGKEEKEGNHTRSLSTTHEMVPALQGKRKKKGKNAPATPFGKREGGEALICSGEFLAWKRVLERREGEKKRKNNPRTQKRAHGGKGRMAQVPLRNSKETIFRKKRGRGGAFYC